MKPATELSRQMIDGDSDGPPDYFYVPEFDDVSAREQFLGPMPKGNSRQTKLPDQVPAYLADLWRTPLLSAEQEKHCFRKLHCLKFLAAGADRDAASCLGTAAMANDRKRFLEQALQVRNQIVESNLRLVVSLAKKYASYGSNEFDELVCAGNAALLRAVDRFDFRRGLRFSTYAYQAIQRAMFTEFRKEGFLKTKFAAEGHDVAAATISDAAECDVAEIEAAEARRQAIRLIKALDARDRKIVMSRFGINRKHGGVPFHVIAKEIGLSQSRTLQLFHRSMKTMREALAKRKPKTKSPLSYCP